MKTLAKCSSSIWAPVSPPSQHVPITRVLCARYVLGVRCHRIDVARDGCSQMESSVHTVMLSDTKGTAGNPDPVAFHSGP